MKANTATLIAGVVLVYLLLKNQTQVRQYPPQPAYVPGSPHWSQWAMQVITLAGGLASDLFGPGGPFEGLSREQVVQETNYSQYSGYIPYGI